MLGAVRRPKRQEVVVVVRQRSTAADRNQPWVADFAQDHPPSLARKRKGGALVGPAQSLMRTT